MKKQQHIYLIRHGKSSWKDESLRDSQRPLKKRGIRDGTTMGRRLALVGVHPDLILTSPAVRARKTAQLIAKEVGCDRIECVDALYPGSVQLYLEALELACRSVDTVFLVAHNHGITELAWFLTGEEFTNVVTTGVVAISYDRGFVRTPGTGRLLFYDYPRKATS